MDGYGYAWMHVVYCPLPVVKTKKLLKAFCRKGCYYSNNPVARTILLKLAEPSLLVDVVAINGFAP